MNIKEQLKNSILKNNDINNMLKNILYYYIYNRINKNDIIELLELYNNIYDDKLKLDYISLHDNEIKISNGEKYYKIELMEE